tara:strand:- start:1241 stop:2131 length:891 start_codon:yes stop_codon:yes gene_type:complete
MMQLRRVPVLKQLGVLALLLFVVLGYALIPQKDESKSVAVEVRPKDNATVDKIFLDKDSLEAQSAFVYDLTHQRVLFEKSPDTVRPLASLTKLMTLLLVYELGDTREIIGEYQVEELADLTLLSSSNQGARLLASSIGSNLTQNNAHQDAFVTAMNLRAEELGLNSFLFYNATGLDLDENEAGAYGSARDVAFLLGYIITKIPEVTERSREESFVFNDPEGNSYEVFSTNQNLSDLPGVIASKTGFTDLAGGNLAVAVDIGVGHPIIIVVLGSSLEGRFQDVKLLNDELLAQYASS